MNVARTAPCSSQNILKLQNSESWSGWKHTVTGQ